MKTLTITTAGNFRETVYPVGTVAVRESVAPFTKSIVEIHGPGGIVIYECKETAEEINAMLAASTANPTEADINRRINLITRALTIHQLPIRSCMEGQILRFNGGIYVFDGEWQLIDNAKAREILEGHAISQLLQERGAGVQA